LQIAAAIPQELDRHFGAPTAMDSRATAHCLILSSMMLHIQKLPSRASMTAHGEKSKM